MLIKLANKQFYRKNYLNFLEDSTQKSSCLQVKILVETTTLFGEFFRNFIVPLRTDLKPRAFRLESPFSQRVM